MADTHARQSQYVRVETVICRLWSTEQPCIMNEQPSRWRMRRSRWRVFFSFFSLTYHMLACHAYFIGHVWLGSCLPREPDRCCMQVYVCVCQWKQIKHQNCLCVYLSVRSRIDLNSVCTGGWSTWYQDKVLDYIPPQVEFVRVQIFTHTSHFKCVYVIWRCSLLVKDIAINIMQTNAIIEPHILKTRAMKCYI